jgi:hypothetical protein
VGTGTGRVLVRIYVCTTFVVMTFEGAHGIIDAYKRCRHRMLGSFFFLCLSLY